MFYLTIVHRLLQDRPEIQRELKRTGALRSTVERYAVDLQTEHARWTDELRQRRPASSPTQLASEALELAVQELADRLGGVESADEAGLSLDGVMASVIRRTPPG